MTGSAMRLAVLMLALAPAAVVGLEPPQSGTVTEATRQANQSIRANLPLDDQQDFANATRGLLARVEEDRILNADGSVAWQVRQFDFIDGDAPDSVNPSLWRQSRLNSVHGLFQVAEGIYQVRGYDIAVMTLIAGERSWIVVDPLTTAATARAGFELAQQTLGSRPVSAVIYTHSHGDHFGGVRGIVSQEDLAAGNVQIIAPHGFLAEAIGENVLAGTAMSRRAQLQFGSFVPPGTAGNVGVGLGQVLARGPIDMIPPTRELPAEGSSLTLDGVQFEFLDAGETEAPAELVFYLPQHRALHGAEVITRTFHNVLTPRGALVRDALKWSQVIDDVLARYGDRSDVLLASHHWPTWGADEVGQTLRNQRDIYRYVHDQTLRLANQGLTMHEIAEAIGEPDFSATDFGTRGYYGTINHNSKAVYQRYFGWWDAVPANYHQLPPEEASKKYVAAMGGAEQALTTARQAFADGDYRWAATLFNHLVFADGANQVARQWLAATYEQLAFQAEAGTWRNIYLTGAMELRRSPADDAPISSINAGTLSTIPAIDLFNAIATRFNPARMQGEPALIQFDFPDRNETVTVDVRRSVLFPRAAAHPQAGTRVTITRSDLTRLLTQEATMPDLLGSGAVRIEGNGAALSTLFGALDPVAPQFDIVTP
jgi:alkyl sulfatase BDS1-like metallo-beta-lactamase superfamily hydrolase